MDQVVLVGDLVNKGPSSVECVRHARQEGFLSTRGNHDDAALFAWERRESERRDGGTATSDEKYAYTDAFTAEDVEYLRELPYTILLEREAVLVVHAGLVPSTPLRDQRPEHMYTMRNLVREHDGSWQALATTHAGGPWAAEWQPDAAVPARHVVFGHDAKRGLQEHVHATGLDTGACYGGRLTALILPEWRIISVPAHRMYSEPKEKPK